MYRIALIMSLFWIPPVYSQTLAPTPNLALTGPNGTGIIHDIELTADGGFVIGGEFQLTSPSRSNILKLTSALAVDPNFTATTNGPVYVIHQLQDNSLVIGGQFSSVNRASRLNIARLGSGGTLNTGWLASVNNTVFAVTSSATDVYAGGRFSSASSGGASASRQRIAKFNGSNGALDGTFILNQPNEVWALQWTAAGLYVGGFGSFSPASASLRRVNATNGAIDAGWTPSVTCTNSSVCSNPAILHLQASSDGQVYFSGIFDTVNGSTQRLISRVSAATGQLDSGWQPVTGLFARTEGLEFSFDSDNHVYLASDFGGGSYGGVTRKIARISRSTGALDTQFNAGGVGAFSIVSTSAGVMIGGEFFGPVLGENRSGVARLVPTSIFRNGFEP